MSSNLHSAKTYRSFAFRQKPTAPCAQCGEELAAPEWSEDLSETRVRLLWGCHACGYTFETLVVFAETARDRAA